MKKLLTLIVLAILHCPSSIVHSENISDVFTSMPDSILPLLTEKNRHDMLDFYQNKMEAKVRNRLGDYVLLDTLTESYLRLQLSRSATAELRMLETDDSVSLIALVQTVGGPVRDSSVRFYDTNWMRLYWLELPVPETADFFSELTDGEPDSIAREDDEAPRIGLAEVQRSVDDLRLVEVKADADEPVFTLLLSIDELARDEKRLAHRSVHPLRYRWTGRDFVRE